MCSLQFVRLTTLHQTCFDAETDLVVVFLPAFVTRWELNPSYGGNGR